MTTTEQCHICDGVAIEICESTEVRVGRRKVSVESPRMRCTSCGSEFYLPGQMAAEQTLATSKIREESALLDSQEIIAIRESYGLTQAAFEKLLGVGAKTVVRWERGTVFQNRATDALLRVIGAVPAAAQHLALIHGLTLTIRVHPSAPSLSMQPFIDEQLGEQSAEESEAGVSHVDGILHLDDFRRRRAQMTPIPDEMLERVQL